MTPPDTANPQEPRFKIPIWIWIVTLGALAFFAFTLWQAQTMQRELNELQLQMRLERGKKKTLEAQRREMEQIRALLAAPDTRAAQLKPTTSEAQPTQFFWNDEMGVLAIIHSSIELTPRAVFHLWIEMKNGEFVDGGVFRAEKNRTEMKLFRPAKPLLRKDASSVFVTVELQGGYSQPQSEPLLVGIIR